MLSAASMLIKRKVKRSVIYAIIGFVSVFIIIQLANKKKPLSQIEMEHLYLPVSMRTQHMAIISSTYFPKSESYTPHTMVMLFNAPKFFNTPYPLLCISNGEETDPTNETKNSVEVRSLALIRYAYLPIQLCNWTSYIATCNVAKNPVRFGLTDIRDDSQFIQLQHRVAKQPVEQKKLGVVSCFSPLFYNEKWQLTLLTIEIYRQMGVSLQIYYVQSMIKEILEFMQIYEREKYLHIEKWDKIYLTENEESVDSLGFDPNPELDWRNQATAHSDCLIHFREGAEFVIVSDIDDVLIPRVGKTFLEEFHYFTKLYPEAAGFRYNRFNIILPTNNDPALFTIASTLKNAEVSNFWEDEKSVVHGSRVQTIWLHWPGIIDKGKMQTIPIGMNFMGHFRNWTTIYGNKTKIERILSKDQWNKYKITDMISNERIDQLEIGFRQFLNSTKDAKEKYDRLPLQEHYYSSIIDCYNRIFYSKRRMPASCPGPSRCPLPTLPGVSCYIGKRYYSHNVIDEKVFVHHQSIESEFILSKNGCSL